MPYAGRFSRLTSGNRLLTLEGLQRFLVDEQKDAQAANREYVEQLIRRHMSPGAEDRPAAWSVDEFGQWIASADNEAWDPLKDAVYQDMDQPLSHYWISSSHNTYALLADVVNLPGLRTWCKTGDGSVYSQTPIVLISDCRWPESHTPTHMQRSAQEASTYLIRLLLFIQCNA